MEEEASIAATKSIWGAYSDITNTAVAMDCNINVVSDSEKRFKVEGEHSKRQRLATQGWKLRINDSQVP